MEKYLLLIIIIFTTNLSFAQKKYSFKNGGAVLQNGVKIAPDTVRMLLVNDQKTLDLYNAGRTKKTFGNVLIYGGIGTMIGKLIVDATSSTPKKTYSSAYNSSINIKQETRTPTGYIIGGAMILSGSIIKGGFSKKIKKAVALMNENPQNSKTAFIESSYIILNNDGFGIAFTF